MNDVKKIYKHTIIILLNKKFPYVRQRKVGERHLCEYLGIKRGTLSKWIYATAENKNGIPETKMIRLAKWFNVRFEELYTTEYLEFINFNNTENGNDNTNGHVEGAQGTPQHDTSAVGTDNR